MGHQKTAMGKAWPYNNFAWFMEMGTGKTYSAINLAAARFINEQINAMVVVCPTPIKLVWESEFETFCPVPYDIFVMHSGKNKEAERFTAKTYDEPTLKVFVVGIESFSQGKAADLAIGFAKAHETKTVIDESSRIKNDKAARTKKVYKLGEQSVFRLIMTGTPITQGMEDLYSQFRFLNQWIIGCKSFFQFRNKYCIMGGFENRSVIGYQNTQQLMKAVSQYIYSVKTKECIDMPDKIYRKLMVEPTKEQVEVIKSLKDLFEAEVEGDVLITETVLERLTRYQQVCGGNFPYNHEEGGYDTKPIVGPNPKLDALIEDIESLDNNHKVIIWARFRPEIKAISEALRAKYGKDSVVEFHGGVEYEERKQGVKNFQGEGGPRFFISGQSIGGMGITLTAAFHTYYYSNSFSFEDRVQSEARSWRKGQTNKCTYTDIVMNIPYDKMITAAIRNKQNMATYVDEQIEHNQIVQNTN